MTNKLPPEVEKRLEEILHHEVVYGNPTFSSDPWREAKDLVAQEITRARGELLEKVRNNLANLINAGGDVSAGELEDYLDQLKEENK